jgi:hypothetical protein
MHFPEKRLVPRIAVTKLPPDTLTLIADGQHFKLGELKDISESGIRCQINQSLPVSAKVAIQYTDAKVQIAVHGRVAWCRQTQDGENADKVHGAYMMGVELMSPMILFAVLPKEPSLK